MEAYVRVIYLAVLNLLGVWETVCWGCGGCLYGFKILKCNLYVKKFMISVWSKLSVECVRYCVTSSPGDITAVKECRTLSLNFEQKVLKCEKNQQKVEWTTLSTHTNLASGVGGAICLFSSLSWTNAFSLRGSSSDNPINPT